MKLIDLSQPLFDGCPNCPAHAAVRMEIVNAHSDGGPESWHLEHLSFTSHTGSHVDAPLHKLRGGKSLDAFSLDEWTGAARIVDVRGIAADAEITAEMLEARLPTSVENEWVLIATGFGDKRAKSTEWLHHPPVLAADGARWLVKQGARGVGIDHFSIGDAVTHTILLTKPVLIVEELRFPAEVFSLPQPVQFMALPLHLQSHSGAPCRPVLVI